MCGKSPILYLNIRCTFKASTVWQLHCPPSHYSHPSPTLYSSTIFTIWKLTHYNYHYHYHYQLPILNAKKNKTQGRGTFSKRSLNHVCEFGLIQIALSL
jgi:hypothetical protein